MIVDRPLEITDLSREDLIHMVGIFISDVFVHYGMWFTETVHSQGIEKALELDDQVLGPYFQLAASRLAQHFGIEMDGSVPKALTTKTREELLILLAEVAKTWVVGDGLWFQAVEASADMDQAKLVNDTCWSHFAHMEAYKIRKFLNLGPRGGLDALEKALRLRLYSSINAHSSSWEDDGSLLFAMTECRVQSARRRKGMQDYPCKSAGIVEYSNFAASLDPRILTECHYCPPDHVPDEQFCAWRFRLRTE
ncbi:MAG: cytosolic protein [Deltaproteobacteria bacterium]|nr:cytosolic protein [Deltaproteobacteria bacterium]